MTNNVLKKTCKQLVVA